MEKVLLVIEIFVAIALVATILLQRSEGGALGIGGGAGGLMSARGAGDMLSKTTKWLAIAFLSITLGLSWLAQKRTGEQSVADIVEQEAAENAKPSDIPEIPTIPESD